LSTEHTTWSRLSVGFAITFMLIMVVGGGVLFAQDVPAGGDASSEDKGELITAADKVEMTPQKMVSSASELLEKLGQNKKTVEVLRAEAIKQRDVIKVNCIDDKLEQFKQLLRIAKTAQVNLDEMIAIKDEEGRYHEHGKIMVTDEQGRNLVDEAKACIGEELIYGGPLDVDVDGPELPDDPSIEDNSIDLEPPAYASPFA
jgi:hypothetical protein